MKKVTALMLAMLLCLSLLPRVQAENEEPEPELAGYTYEDALHYIGEMGWEGFSGSINAVNAVVWLPNFMSRVEVTEEMTKAGVLKSYASEYLIVQIVLADYGDETLEDYLEAIPEEGGLNERIEQVNERDWLIYDREIKNVALCRLAATKLPEGKFLEIMYIAGDVALNNMIETSIASLRFREG